MGIRPNSYKFFLLFSLILIFMISSCSKPAEDKKLPAKQVSETVKTEKTIVETPTPIAPKPETPVPETPKPAPEPVVSKPETPKPVKPEPVTPKPVIESGLADVITMKNPAYKKHKKSIVLFTHKKHVKEYKIDCGECHHDKDGTPIKGLKDNDKVESCISCHAKIGQAPRPKDKKKLSKKEKLEYHAEAIHENCIKCHKEFNKKNGTKAAPASCSKCHPKKT